MKNDYSEMLESYIIAEEGIGTAIIASVAGIWAGYKIISGITARNEIRKLNKEIKNNKGKIADYSSASSWTIVDKYFDKIELISEPKDFEKLVPIYNKCISYIKEIISLQHTLQKDLNKAKSIVIKFDNIGNQIASLEKNYESIIQNIKSSEKVTHKFKDSTFYKLMNLEKNYKDIVTKEGYNDDYLVRYSDDEEYRDKLYNNEYYEDLICYSMFDDANVIMCATNLLDYCKLGINPNTKIKKSII